MTRPLNFPVSYCIKDKKMAKEIKNVRSITEEALFLKEKEMDYNLTKVFSGDWKGSRLEKNELDKLKNKLKDDMYIEVIYILTHKIIRDVKEAKHLLLPRGRLLRRIYPLAATLSTFL